MFAFAMEVCGESIENHILVAKVGAGTLLLSICLSDSLNVMDLYLGNHLSLFSFFFVLLPYHFLFF
jgi:hypothetical protein